MELINVKCVGAQLQLSYRDLIYYEYTKWSHKTTFYGPQQFKNIWVSNRRVDWQIVTDVSDDLPASIFRIQ